MRQFEEINKKIKEADAILIGASNGFSITEGIHLFAENKEFESLFGDFKQKYGIRCILQGLMFQWPSEDEKWAFYSRLVWHYDGDYQGSPAMENLKRIVGKKPYFIVTSNGEGHFELAGFEKERIYEIEGGWLQMQCADRCSDQLYPSLNVIQELSRYEKNGEIPTEMVPRCPHCGGAMNLHIQTDANFIPNTKQAAHFQSFIQQYHGKKLVVLELGIGWRNQLIKAPFMQLVAQEEYCTYITINKGEVYIPESISDRSFGADGAIGDVLKGLRA